MIFYLTFGQKSPARNGWVEVYASSYDEARALVESKFNSEWSWLYQEHDFHRRHFPVGRLDTLGRISDAYQREPAAPSEPEAKR